VKKEICEALRKDPTKTAKELQQGDGIGYPPCQFAPAAAENGTWISIVGKEYKKTEAGMGARSLIVLTVSQECFLFSLYLFLSSNFVCSSFD
jgi:hypothetical protein